MGLLDRLFRRFGRDPERERFADEVLRALRTAGVARPRYRRADFTILFDEGPDQAARLYLGNMYAECQLDPEFRGERIRQFVAAFTNRDARPETFEEACADLRPVLRHPAYGAGAPRGFPVLRRPALPFLDEMVVLDRPHHMSYVNVAEATTWGVSDEQVFAAARASLAGLGELPAIVGDAGPRVIRLVDDGDAYFVSRVLVGDWLPALAAHVGADRADDSGGAVPGGEHLAGADPMGAGPVGPRRRPVAFAPDTSTVVVAPDEPALIAGLYQQMAEQYAEAPRGLSPMGYTVDDRGRVVPYEPAPGHPAYLAAEAAYRRLALDAYEGQRANLGRAVTDRAATDRAETGVFAECTMVARPDGSTFTIAEWTVGRETLLPHVDFVALLDVDGRLSVIPWAVLVESDTAFEAVEYHPARYRTSAVPTPEALGYLRERAVEP